MGGLKILNLYAGIGGNRKHWNGEKHDITAVEWDKTKAEVYSHYFPKDNVVVEDAHAYLKENYSKYDFIWSSPPCPTHSKIRNEAGVGRGQNKPVYPDMNLYEEIIFLRRISRSPGVDFNGKYVVENVIPDYEVLINAQKTQRHLFWANFDVPDVDIDKDNINTGTLEELQRHHGFDLSAYDISHKKKVKMLRNCVHPKIGKAIFQARNTKQTKIGEIT